MKPIHWLLVVLLLAVGVTSAIILGQRNETVRAEAEVVSQPASSATVLDAHVAWGQGLFQLTNRDGFTWNQCKFEVNAQDFGDGYSYKLPSLQGKTTLRILAEDFRAADGTSYSLATEDPNRFTIRCLDANGKPGIYVGKVR